ncbi:MAG: transketolase [candidate division Zixibacteria bacterium]|nr:transketolase [candidate division Zixibacteria bacterium]
MYDPWRGFTEAKLTPEWTKKLTDMTRRGRGDILKMTTVAGSGHPGGSMSSLETYLMLYNFARINPNEPYADDRDRIIISNGHTSPGVYVALGYTGFFDVNDALYGFRVAGSPFEGHVERTVPGVEWDTGNLGQGLAVGVGKAIYSRLSGQKFHTYVVMGDGEQQKGQIGESRRHAIKYGLNDITVVIDYNHRQISGAVEKVMPQNIKAEWEADGWGVMEINAHDLDQVYTALQHTTHHDARPHMILAHSVMGKGVSFMENNESFHGAVVKADRIGEALKELGGIENDIKTLLKKRSAGPPAKFPSPPIGGVEVKPGVPIVYGPDDKSDNRSAWGRALMSVAEANIGRDDFRVAVFDCDLSGSVKTKAFGYKYPDNFFQLGIAEHATAVTAGSLSVEKALSVWAAFGMFGVAETYNQARLSDINHSNLKLFCTHSGINVGEDGKTHQSIDYFGLLNSTFGWKVITPADPNQTDRVVRHALTTEGNFAVIMGRSVIPTVLDENGVPFFGDKYKYQYGRMDKVRTGEKLALVSAGNMLDNALDAYKRLTAEGHRIALISVSDWSDLHKDDLAMLGGFDYLVILEDHNVKTGLGTAIGSALMEAGHPVRLTKLGVTQYASSGKPADLYRMSGLDGESVANKIKSLLG